MGNTTDLDMLLAAIREDRPLVLLLGQDAWSNKNKPDPIFVSALKRANRYTKEAVEAGMPSLLNKEPLPQDFYEWLADLYENNPEPEWMEVVASLSLSAVYTTSIDPSLSRKFRLKGRDVQPVLSTDDAPSSPRERQNLHLTYLFGRAGEARENEAPPKSNQELIKRTTLQSTPLLGRALDTTTGMGIFLIDGFSCGKDWLSTSTLYGMLSAFGTSQVYWFGWDRRPDHADEDAELIKGLATQVGPVVLIKERLANVLRDLELANQIDLSEIRKAASEYSVTIGDSVLQISPSTRLKTSTAASIIDDTWLEPLPPLGLDVEYMEFRRFHGQIEDTRKLIEGIRRNFSIRRKWEDELRTRVEKALSDAGKNHEPLLVHGQSGSGKSLALARLAYEIRSMKRYPVLLISRLARLPAVNELDEFCLRAEDAGASATLLICDANLSLSRYRELMRGFSSRGRRVVVVGSTYRIIDESSSTNSTTNNHTLEIPAELENEELDALSSLLEKFTGTSHKFSESQYLLPAMYRMLPEIRPHLAAGLAMEARVAEEHLHAHGKMRTIRSSNDVGKLEQAFIDAGVQINPKTLLEERINEFLGVITTTASSMIDYVMLSGKLGCSVPINLLMRAVGGTSNLIDINMLFSSIDLFRWSANEEGDIFIHPRLRLEAELISARRLGTSYAEAEVAIKLLESANPNSYDSCERRFVLDLVHQLGPDGPYKQRYSKSFLEIARALTEMRIKKGVLDPSFMLQEATLRRRFIRDKPLNEDIDSASILDEARDIVDHALSEFSRPSSSGLRRICANLKVERAAIYGFRAVQRLKEGAPMDEVWQFYSAARDSSRTAVYAVDTYFAVDVSLWVPNDLLNDERWSATRRAELISDIWDALDRIDPGQLDYDQREQYEGRRVKIGQTLNNHELEEDALKVLEESGSLAGFYLRARKVGGSLSGQEAPSSEDIKKATQATDFLNKNKEKINEDARCLRYMLRSLWLVYTKSYLFGGERFPLPANDDDIQYLLDIVERLNDLEGGASDPRFKYLQAVLLWRLQRENSARELWKELDHETAYNDPRRVIRHHLWTGPDGKPQVFHGRIVEVGPRPGHVRVQVEGVRQNIALLQRDFDEFELRKGMNIRGGFYIAFNYIGPVAVRPRQLRGSVR